ncbi:hypothetical protein B9Z55_001935 [Caenorhabditis nigoni]|uniref:Uncharacterized protein n=1 Tax=Caenorhabditis nigoni TaxID=1611254 RepID=A0A2G5VI37_9PELO|nr:hypothetical protein B9Z55_001935 [Caenorhabditis nigoni]
MLTASSFESRELASRCVTSESACLESLVSLRSFTCLSSTHYFRYKTPQHIPYALTKPENEKVGGVLSVSKQEGEEVGDEDFVYFLWFTT